MVTVPLYVVWWTQLSAMSLLLTVWDDGGEAAIDVFLGEVLLDLASADVRGSIVWYDLQEHDLNCSSVPLPSPKVGRSSQTGAAVRRSISMSRQSSRDSSGRSTMSPDITRTINYFNCHFL